MTEQPVVQPAEAKPAEVPSRLALAARRARYAILWERVWPPLAALATAAGLFFALSWLGLWLWLPPLGRAAGLVLFGVLALWAAFPFLFLRLPGFGDALHRIDRVSGLRHRPATTLADRLAVNAQDPYALALWNAHVARSLQNANALRAGMPAPRVAGRDPYALRGLVLVAVIATFIAAGGERWHRVAAAFDWRGVVVPANFRVDAWVAPPAYTGRPPIILPGIHPGETGAAAVQTDGPISVPVNSTLVVRATGKLKLELSTTGGLVPANEEGRPPAGAEEHRFTVTATGAATLRGAGENLVWPLNAVPDKPPTIALIKDPEQQSRGSLLLSYRLEDDYGVAEAQATFARKDDPGGHPGVQAARPLFGPPDFALVLPQARTKNGTGQTIKDLTDHPWAGAEVTLTLVARDDAGNEGRSEPFDFRLPERVFTKPLARALIEQRRNLALDANTRPLVTTALDALAIAPERFTQRSRHLSRSALGVLVARARQERRRFARCRQTAVADGGRHRGRRHCQCRGSVAQRRECAAAGARPRRQRSGAQGADGAAARGDGPFSAGDGGTAEKQPRACPPAQPQYPRALFARSAKHARPVGKSRAQRRQGRRAPAFAAAAGDDGKPAGRHAGHERGRRGHDVGAR